MHRVAFEGHSSSCSSRTTRLLRVEETCNSLSAVTFYRVGLEGHAGQFWLHNIKKSDHVFLPPIAARQLLSIITHTSAAAVIRASRWLAPNSGEEFGSPQPGCVLLFCFFCCGLPHGLAGAVEGREAEAHCRQTCQHRMMGAHIAPFYIALLRDGSQKNLRFLYMLSAIAVPSHMRHHARLNWSMTKFGQLAYNL